MCPECHVDSFLRNKFRYVTSAVCAVSDLAEAGMEGARRTGPGTGHRKASPTF